MHPGRMEVAKYFSASPHELRRIKYPAEMAPHPEQRGTRLRKMGIWKIK
jgi:hypothetical protein